MIKLSIGQIHHELSLFSANSLSIYCQNLEFSLNPISVLQIRYLFRENTINSLFFRVYTLKSLSVSRLHYEITVCFASSLTFWRIHYEFTWCFAIHNEFTWCFAIHYELTIFSRSYCQFTIFFANSL